MNVQVVCLFGGLGCLFALTVLAAIATIAEDEVPFFTYCVGAVLVVAALILFSAVNP